MINLNQHVISRVLDPMLTLALVLPALKVFGHVGRHRCRSGLEMMLDPVELHRWRQELTGFSILEAEKVCGCVTVFWTVGSGRNVFAMLYALVGNNGLNTLAVILVGGIGCMGAYFVSPVCRLNGVSKTSPPGAPPCPSLLIAPGPAVAPPSAVTAAITAGSTGGPPLNPVMLKRSDQLTYEPPPVVANDVSLKKLSRRKN
jgi:hypothetical protein